MQPAQRQLVVVNELAGAGKRRLKYMYVGVEHAVRHYTAHVLGQHYRSITTLEGSRASAVGVVEALTRAGKPPDVLAVDLFLVAHGMPGALKLPSVTGKSMSTVAVADLAASIAARGPALTTKLRLCYSLACFGASHAPSLRTIAGFRTVVGAEGENTTGLTEFTDVVPYWAARRTIGDAVRKGDDPVKRMISDQVAKFLGFDEADSKKVIVGPNSVTIDS